MSSMYWGMSSLRCSACGRIPAGPIMTNERARNRHDCSIQSPAVGAAHEQMLGVAHVGDGADAPPGGVVDADPGADVPGPRNRDGADVAAAGQERLDLV